MSGSQFGLGLVLNLLIDFGQLHCSFIACSLKLYLKVKVQMKQNKIKQTSKYNKMHVVY